MAEKSEARKERNELPYAAEYAKSGRAVCKACQTSITQVILRLYLVPPSVLLVLLLPLSVLG